MKREIDRAFLILELEKANPLQTAKRLKCNKEKAYRWYHRTQKLIDYFKQLPPITDGATERLIPIESYLKELNKA